MATIVGTGDFKYRIVENWAKLPDGWSFKEVGAVGCDKNDNVYVFNRGEHPMMVFDRDGKFLRSWGEGEYPRAHGVHMGPDESIYLTDDGDSFVRKCRLEDGKGLRELGVPGKPAPYMSGEPVHRASPTLGPRVSIVDNQGKLLSRFGDMHAGTAPTAFLGPHGLTVDSRGDLYVGEVSWTQWPQFFPETPRPAYIRSLQKYERVQ